MEEVAMGEGPRIPELQIPSAEEFNRGMDIVGTSECSGKTIALLSMTNRHDDDGTDDGEDNGTDDGEDDDTDDGEDNGPKDSLIFPIKSEDSLVVSIKSKDSLTVPKKSEGSATFTVRSACSGAPKNVFDPGGTWFDLIAVVILYLVVVCCG